MNKYICSFHAVINESSEEEARRAMSNNLACEHREADIECFKIELSGSETVSATCKDRVDIGAKP